MDPYKGASCSFYNVDGDEATLCNLMSLDHPDMKPVVENISMLIKEFPTIGICLGHQILGLALGGETYKLKYGHRGGNQPVKHLRTENVYITSQNHGFALHNLPKGVRETFVNLNDGTCEGISGKNCWSVQFHPEAQDQAQNEDKPRSRRQGGTASTKSAGAASQWDSR